MKRIDADRNVREIRQGYKEILDELQASLNGRKNILADRNMDLINHRIKALDNRLPFIKQHQTEREVEWVYEQRTKLIRVWNPLVEAVGFLKGRYGE